MKVVFFVLFNIICLNLFSQDVVGYYITKQNNKVELFEKAAKKDSTFFMTPYLIYWNQYGLKLRVNSKKLKEFKINEAFYNEYEYFKNLKRLKRYKSEKAFGQLLISSDNYSLYYYLSNVQATRGNTDGMLLVINKNNHLLIEKSTLSNSSIKKKREQLNQIANKYFNKCRNVYDKHFNHIDKLP